MIKGNITKIAQSLMMDTLRSSFNRNLQSFNPYKIIHYSTCQADIPAHVHLQ